MKGVTLVIALCLNIGTVLSRATLNSCQGSIDGACGRGQHVLFSEEFGQICVNCPINTYMDLPSHNCESCKEHTQPNSKEVIIIKGGSMADNVVICVRGYFRANTVYSNVRGDCEKCTFCGDGMWAARECGPEEDTFCCPDGLVADLKEGGSLTCVLTDSSMLYHTQVLRKERSSGNIQPNSTNTNADEAGNDDKSRDKSLDDDKDYNPNHGYSQADYESENQQNKVDFPVWARILCAGVALGVFLFYLGVGIPCNVCGSKDKLRALKKRIFHRHEEEPTAETPKEKPQGKPEGKPEEKPEGKPEEKPEENPKTTSDPI